MRLFFACAVAWCAAYLVCQHPVQAAKLVVLATNSGIDTTFPYISTQPPNIGPGTKGFLIGIDLEDDLIDVPLGVQEIEFMGVVHQQGQKDELGDPLPTPLNIKTRSTAILQETIDGVATNGYRRSDTYVMDNAQQGNVWISVGPGIQGGNVGDTFFRITASLGVPSPIDGPGPVQLAYVVTNQDVMISGDGIIARGSDGFDPGGNPLGSHPMGYVLRYTKGDIVPYPAPLGAAWLQPAGGLFSVGANWTDGVSPDGTENAVFDLPATYSVTFNVNEESAQLYVSNGNITFDLAGNTYSLSLPVDSVLVAEQGGQVSRLTITNGTLSSVSGTIAKLSGSDGRVTVASGGTWNVAADLTVGSGTGALTVEPGGSVTVGTTLRVVDGGTVHHSGGAINAPLVQVQGGTFNLNSGTLEFSGGQLTISAGGQFNGAFDVENGDSVTVSGAGSAWQSPAAIGVGGAGTGDVMVADGASVTTTTTRIGFTAGSQGAVTVDGSGSTWTSTNLIEVGSEVGQGSLSVSAGGGVTSTNVSIGELSSTVGTMTVTGSGSTATLSDKLEVGVAGQGALEVLSGGAVSAVNAAIGRDPGSSGIANVSGAGSAVVLSEKLEVGVSGAGELHVSAGGSVTAPVAHIARSDGSSGIVEVNGAGSTLATTGALYVGGAADATGGTAQLLVNSGGNVTAGTALIIKHFGSVTVSGGTLNYASLELAGGSLTQATIDLSGKDVSGFGALVGNVMGNGTVTSRGGTLTLGNPASTTGVSFAGTLAVEENAHLVLLDANSAVLGDTTTLAQGAQLNAPNGLLLPAGGSLNAVETSTIANAFTNNGAVNGPSEPGKVLTFAGDVDGQGQFTGNIAFAGQLTPGTSISPLYVAGNATFTPTATMIFEVNGGTAVPPGPFVVGANVVLGGTFAAQVISGLQPALGSTFVVMTFGSRTGDFATYAIPALDGNLALKPWFLPNSLVLRALPAIDGDINLDGIVDIFDVNTVSAHWGTPGPQGDVNGDGAVNIFDVNVISGNWHATGSGATVVPEPSTVALSICAAVLLLTACRPALGPPAR